MGANSGSRIFPDVRRHGLLVFRGLHCARLSGMVSPRRTQRTLQRSDIGAQVKHGQALLQPKPFCRQAIGQAVPADCYRAGASSSGAGISNKMTCMIESGCRCAVTYVQSRTRVAVPKRDPELLTETLGDLDGKSPLFSGPEIRVWRPF